MKALAKERGSSQSSFSPAQVKKMEIEYQGILSGNVLALQGLFAWCVRKVQQQFGQKLYDRAEDIANRALEKLMERLPEKRAEGATEEDFLGYAFTVVKNFAIKEFKESQKRSEVNLEEFSDEKQAARSISEQVASDNLDDLLDRLPGAIQRLPDKFRDFIWARMKFLAEFPDRTLKEFAELQGLTATNAGAINSRACGMLRNILSEGSEQ